MSPASRRSGNHAYCAVFHNENGHSTHLFQKLAVDRGGKYQLSLWVSQESQSESWRGVNFSMTPDVKYAYTIVSRRDVPPNQWQQITVNLQATAP